MKVGDLAWFKNPSYTNPYGGKRDKVLVLIEEIKVVEGFVRYYFIIVETGKKLWTKEPYLERLDI
jgi:hypothetical protein